MEENPLSSILRKMRSLHDSKLFNQSSSLPKQRLVMVLVPRRAHTRVGSITGAFLLKTGDGGRKGRWNLRQGGKKRGKEKEA